MLGRLQGMGVKVIVGDIVVDRSAFQVQGHDAAAFDGEPFKPTTRGRMPLLINYKTQVLGFIPDGAAGVARIHYELPMGRAAGTRQCAAGAPGTACGDWRSASCRRTGVTPQRIELPRPLPRQLRR